MKNYQESTPSGESSFMKKVKRNHQISALGVNQRIQNIDLLRQEFKRRKSRLLNTSKTSQELQQKKYLKVNNLKLKRIRKKENSLLN